MQTIPPGPKGTAETKHLKHHHARLNLACHGVPGACWASAKGIRPQKLPGQPTKPRQCILHRKRNTSPVTYQNPSEGNFIELTPLSLSPPKASSCETTTLNKTGQEETLRTEASAWQRPWPNCRGTAQKDMNNVCL